MHLTRLWEECRGQLEDGFVNMVIDLAGEDGAQVSQSDIDVSVEDPSLTTDASESLARRMGFGLTVSGQSVNGALDFVALRSDRIVGQGFCFVLGTPDVSEEEEIINDFVGNMEQANESLKRRAN